MTHRKIIEDELPTIPHPTFNPGEVVHLSTSTIYPKPVVARVSFAIWQPSAKEWVYFFEERNEGVTEQEIRAFYDEATGIWYRFEDEED